MGEHVAIGITFNHFLTLIVESLLFCGNSHLENATQGTFPHERVPPLHEDVKNGIVFSGIDFIYHYVRI